MPPKVFVSYSHDSPNHKEWVKDLAIYLRENGVDIILDQWDLALGTDLAMFMENGLSRSDRVLIIATNNYIEKANSGKGGVAYEKMIATAELLSGQDTNKFIPVVRNVTGDNKLPVFLGSRFYIDLSQDSDDIARRNELLKEIHKARDKKPVIGANPFFRSGKRKKRLTTRERADRKPSINGLESTVFFDNRFSSAFPGIRGVEWFDTQKAIEMRLCKLLESPLDFVDASPIWWWRGGNLHIHSFKSLSNGLYLMDHCELRIIKIAAVNEGAYYQKFVYVETDKTEPTGLYPVTDKRIADAIQSVGYYLEEYGLYKGKVKVTRAEYDDAAAVINGKLVEFNGNVELRIRYITPYNLVIAAQSSPINNIGFDRILKNILNSILLSGASINILSDAVLQLPKRETFK